MAIVIGGGSGNAISINSAVGSNGQVIFSNGSNALWGDLISEQIFIASGTWTKPSIGNLVYVELWGGGGGGARDGSTSGGGGGGAFRWAFIDMGALGATVSVTIGNGGAGRSGTNGAGVNGGLSSFGSITAGGGGGGRSNGGGGGGGGWRTSANLDAVGEGYEIGTALGDAVDAITGFPIVPPTTLWVGSNGGDSTVAGGSSIYGGGGGGGRNSSTVRAGGTSNFGGNGGAGGGTAGVNGTSGSIPGGGGGGCDSATAGSGARGECVVYVW